MSQKSEYEEEDEEDEEEQVYHWTKGVPDPTNDRVNLWSLNGYGDPVLTGGMYLPDEIRLLEKTVKNYCASKNVTVDDLCSTSHNKDVRGAWGEIAQCLPHRTVISVYRRALRQFHGLARGTWSKEEVASLFRLVELHGHRWKTVQQKLGRSAIDCRVKFFDLNDQFDRGKWKVEKVELLLQKVREVLDVPRDDMDVREINQWTLEQNTTIPWTSLSFKVNRRRLDCYFKWKQMTRRSNKMAVLIGLEPIPMARMSMKFDVRAEYFQWKAEQGDAEFQQRYIQEYIVPLLQQNDDGRDVQKEQDLSMLDSIIQSKAIRPSEIPWQTQRKERWEELVECAPDRDLDLPLWKLANVVKGIVMKGADVKKDKGLKKDTDLKTVRESTTFKSRHNPFISSEAFAKESRNKKRQQSNSTVSGKKSKATSQTIEDQFNIPSTDITKVRKKIKTIVQDANHDELTVRGVRMKLEKWLGGMILLDHKSVIKALVIEAINEDRGSDRK